MLKPGITRFILASLVILYHISRFVFLGRFAVCSFFILSGYWITLIFSNKYSKKQKPLKVFYLSRLWRLLPVFYTFTLLAFVVWIFLDHSIIGLIKSLDLPDKIVFWVSNTTLLTYYSLPKVDIMVPAWSLDIELEFYLLFPILFYISRNNYKVLKWLFILFLALSFYLCASCNSAWINNSLLTYLYLFILGMMIFHYQISFKAKTEKVCLCIFAIVVGIQYVIPYAVQHFKSTNSMYYTVISFVLVMLAVPVLANSVRIYSDKRDKFWGELSFMVYLSHWVWIRPYGLLTQNISMPIHLIYAVLFLTLTMGLALIIYWLVDRPMERLRHQWVNNQL